MEIANKDFRIHLKKFCLSIKEIDCLEISTEKLRFLDDDTLCVVTDTFKENGDLSKLTSLKVLSIFGQPLTGELVLSDSIQEIEIEDCGPLLIRVGNLELVVPQSKELWCWTRPKMSE